jgi:hypothetical protein
MSSGIREAAREKESGMLNVNSFVMVDDKKIYTFAKFK